MGCKLREMCCAAFVRTMHLTSPDLFKSNPSRRIFNLRSCLSQEFSRSSRQLVFAEGASTPLHYTVLPGTLPSHQVFDMWLLGTPTQHKNFKHIERSTSSASVLAAAVSEGKRLRPLSQIPFRRFCCSSTSGNLAMPTCPQTKEFCEADND